MMALVSGIGDRAPQGPLKLGERMYISHHIETNIKKHTNIEKLKKKTLKFEILMCTKTTQGKTPCYTKHIHGKIEMSA